MTIEKKLEHTAPDDPDRCKAVGANSQCPFRRWPPSEYCGRHGANGAIQAEEKENLRLYRLSKWKARLEEFAEHPKIKSLREEIGILRIILEETMNRCNDAQELMMLSNKISDLVIKIEKVVASCHRLEQSTGQLLDKAAAISFAAQMVEIIGRHISDPNITDEITNEILQSLTTLSPNVTAKGSE